MSLRAQALRGGVFLTLRQILGLAISLGTVLFVTRTIGPEAYGVYAVASGLATFALQIAQLGVPVYLVRAERSDDNDIHAAFTLLGIIGLIVLILAYPIGVFLERYSRVSGVAEVGFCLLALAPIHLLGVLFLAYLERNLDFGKVSWAELLGTLAQFAIAVFLAWRGLGFWAPTWGWAAGRVLTFFLSVYFSRLRPKLIWDQARWKSMLEYGLGYSASIWLWQARSLVNPLIVAPLAGSHAAGYVALTMRLVESLAFVKSITWRLSIAVLAKVQGDFLRLRRAVEEGMWLQVLLLGPFLVGFAWLGPWVIPRLLGEAWGGVMSLYPFVALSSLANAVFALHSSALYVVRRNWEVGKFHIFHVTLLALGAWVLVRLLGYLGYGIAELVAFLSYGAIHKSFNKIFGPLRYGKTMIAAAAFGLALFYQQLGWPALIPLVIWLFLPSTWERLLTYFRQGGYKNA